MPLFDFVCNKCEHEQELLVRGDEQPCCEACGAIELTKLLSVPAAHTQESSKLQGDFPTGGCGTGCGCH